MKRKQLLVAVLVTTLFLSAGGFTLNYFAVSSKAGMLTMFLHYMGVVADPALQAQIADLSRQMETLQKMVVLLIPQQTSILLQQEEKKRNLDKAPEEGSEKQQDVQTNSSKNDVKNLSDYNQKGESDGPPIPDKADQHPITATKSEEKGTTKTENKSEVVDKSDKKSVSSEEKNGKGKMKARTYAVPPGTCNADTCGGSFDFTHDILTLKEKYDNVLKKIENEKSKILNEVSKARDDSFTDVEKLHLELTKTNSVMRELQKQDDLTLSEQARLIKRQDEILEKLSSIMAENNLLKTKVANLEAGYTATQDDFKQLIDKVEILIDKVEEMQAEEDKIDEEKINKMIGKSLDLYSADRVGMPDYALESAGAVVFTIGDTQPYTVDTPWMGIFGIPIWRSTKTPRLAIQVDTSPGNCWSFTGSKGSLTIQLAAQVFPEFFTIDHIPKSLAPHGDASSAPNHFRVLGLDYGNAPKGHVLGNYEFIEFPIQTFAVQQNPYEKYFRFIKVEVLSNHGNKDYTCLYRFRVHGKPLDISTFNG